MPGLFRRFGNLGCNNLEGSRMQIVSCYRHT
jgi:hypothetical protein